MSHGAPFCEMDAFCEKMELEINFPFAPSNPFVLKSSHFPLCQFEQKISNKTWPGDKH